MAYLLTHLLAFVALWLLFAVSGSALLAWFSCRRDGGIPLWLASPALGALLWIHIALVLAWLQLLTPVAVHGMAALAVVVAAAGFLWRGRAGLRLGTRPPLRPTVAQGILLLGLVVCLLTLFLQTLRPNVSWDANVYHLTVPRLYLEAQGFRRIPFNVYSNLPLGTELLFAVALLFQDYVLAKLVHFGFGLLTVLLVFHLARRIAGAWAGLVASALVLLNPVVLYEMRLAYVDLAYAFYFLLAFAFVLRALDRAPPRRLDLLLAGIACGALLAIKITGVLAVACLVLLYLWPRRGHTHGPPRAWRSLPLLLLPPVVLALPWVLKSLAYTGNPVYPLFHAQFGGPEWNLALGEAHQAWQQGIGMGRAPLDFLLLPFRVFLLGDFGYGRFDGELHWAWLVLLPTAAVVGRKSPLVRRCLGVSLLYFVLWAVTSQQMRFLIPVVPLLAIAVAVAVAEALGRLQAGHWHRPAQLAGAGILTVLLLQANSLYLGQNPRLVRDFLRHDDALFQLVVHPVYVFIDRNLPPRARLLLLNTNHGFFLHREFVADSFFEASQTRALFQDLADSEAVERRFAELSLTHVLIEHRDRGIDYPPAFVSFLNDPQRVQLLYRSPDGRFSVLEVVGVEAPEPGPGKETVPLPQWVAPVDLVRGARGHGL